MTFCTHAFLTTKMSPKKKKQPSSSSTQQDTDDVQEAGLKGKRFTSLATSTSSKPSAATTSFDYTHNCHICASTPHSWAITQCNHRCCSTCVLRMRALYDNRHCPMCKTESTKVLVCRDEHGTFRESGVASLTVPGILYEDDELLRKVESQLVHKCGICLKPQRDKQSLKRHISSDHHRMLCDVCVAHKRVFSHELRTFAHHRDLLVHQKDEHPQCAACGAIFYGEDELGEHCRQRHELCHICDRARRAAPPQNNAQQSVEERRQMESERATQLATLSNAPYFADYATLEEHFSRAHFPCTDPLCRELKFVVFADELELRAHQADMHAVIGTGVRLQRSQQQQLRRIDVSFQRPQMSSRSIPPQEQAAPQVVAQPAVQKTANTGEAAMVETVFGAVSPSSDIARRMQSLSLLGAQNRDFLCSLQDPPLSLSPKIVSLVQQACREYEAGHITADELVRRLAAWIGYDNLRAAPTSSEGTGKTKRLVLHRGWQPLSSGTLPNSPEQAASKGGAVFPRLLELQPDEFKRRELQFALEQHVYKVCKPQITLSMLVYMPACAVCLDGVFSCTRSFFTSQTSHACR